MQKKRTTILFSLVIFLSGCGYVDPFLEMNDASDYVNDYKYPEAISSYENAINGFASVSIYKWLEYDARCEYALMLNEYSKTGETSYILTARENLNLVLNFIQEGNDVIRCSKGVVLSSRANTYQQEAYYSENDDESYQLAKQAYSLYKDAIQPLKKSENWLSLAYNYFNLAETSEMYGDIPNAIRWINKAIEVNKKMGFSDNLLEDSAYLAQLESMRDDQVKSIGEGK